MTVCTKDLLKIKTGADAKFDVLYTNADEEPVDLSGYGIALDFVNRKTGKLLVSTAVGSGITITDAAEGRYFIDAGNTKGWPIGLMSLDIKYTEPNGTVHLTEDFHIFILAGITQ